MKLSELTASLKSLSTFGYTEKEIAGVHFDSRKIAQDWLFVAVDGTQADGHAFIGAAIDSGATAVICQRFPEALVEGVTYISVSDSAEALGLIASAWFGNPSQRLTLIGVTGTNGKTTVATLLYEMFRRLGYGAGLLSTVCNYINSRAVIATHTTPDPVELNSLLAEMVDAGCDYAFMEVSSHATVQRRIAGLDFKGGIFTNLTRDHLDYHKTFEAYRDAKKCFFDALPATAFALANIDDRNGMFILQNTAAAKHTYSLLTLADFKGKITEAHLNGTLMTINGREVETQFVGKFNAYNLLAVYGAAILLGMNRDEVLPELSALIPVAGRFQTFRSPAGYSVIIDYAHTPDALTNVLNAIHEVLKENLVGKDDVERNIITVVGCGGNRDKGKRPMMAKEAARLSSRLILTSDNPRFEEPDDIIADMWAGLSDAETDRTLRITDRREAIRTACSLAREGDVVLIAGKGHEDYQEVRGVKNRFDDREEVMEIFIRLTGSRKRR
ncbi:MAG: UDP-N-acetylmuramoyl-L-alanyl-D-glutamate--2,6-diaminopimelate ligase [Dysgonamonadaceae bacterium]|jgi:UDP-N-acetylmuramoyl-L-alanyl-D-glutamate--2,6-diaminopimelate ligase|nr:UDP-N-acetylmuramoyl-L-alanyl-D-glutamate--2,6-diaminopimelate ligase [Dysgonamonadaceae bacterium]